MHFTFTVLSAPVNQTCRDSTVLNVVVCLSLVVDSGQWCVCVCVCVRERERERKSVFVCVCLCMCVSQFNKPGSQTTDSEFPCQSFVLHALLTVCHFMRNHDTGFVIYTSLAHSPFLVHINYSLSCLFNGGICD